jgi:hydroxysqualene synthase
VNHYENFPVASWLCPKALRPAVTAIYWFARTADDIADEGDAPAQARLAELADYRADLEAVARGDDVSLRWSAVFGRLKLAISEHRLPLPLLNDLLSAFEQDARQPGYANREQLLDYCRRSANPVGRLMLHLYGISDAQALRESDAICTALQLANFWQDLGVDVSRQRYYVPDDDCARHGLPAQRRWQRRDTEATRALVTELVQWARQLMLHGAPLVHRVPGRAGWELRMVVQGGLRILEKVDRLQGATLESRPALRTRDAVPLLWRALMMRADRAVTATAHP